MKESLDQAPEIKVRSSLNADDIQKILPKQNLFSNIFLVKNFQTKASSL